MSAKPTLRGERRIEATFAFLLLLAGHLALANRLGWGWFDLLLLDMWLLPVWFGLIDANRAAIAKATGE